ncbi:MAG: DUF2459 domain-containing protein [Cardiobacteriaceae bacterium]|nr:DUF2459 domain-containing protein [Cardiobacteriaceae bacterium]
MKTIRKILFILLCLPLAYLLAALLAAVIPLPGEMSDEAAPYTIHIASNGVHLNFVLPVRDDVADWAAFLPDAALEDSSHFLLGWGSATFYTQVHTWGDLRPGIALRALFYDHGLIRIEAMRGVLNPAHPRVRTLHLPQAQYHALIADLQGQFRARHAVQPGFYPAHGRYTPLFTCNEWLRRRLRHIGVRTPLWSPFDRPLLWML